MLNAVWVGIILLSCFGVLVQSFMVGAQAWQLWVTALFDMSRLSVDIALGLIGALCFWMGLFQIAERSGVLETISQKLSPIFKRLMPSLPAGHPALGHITMNLSANVFGLDNAATPMGIQAMQSMQNLNQTSSISDAQLLFVVLNTTSVTLLPMTIIMYRAQLGAAQPADVLLPIILATSCSSLLGLSIVAWRQKLNIFSPGIIVGVFIYLLILIAITLVAVMLPNGQNILAGFGNGLVVAVVAGLLILGVKAKLDVYQEFITGAKQGFQVAVNIIPYLVAMLVAIGLLRASGVFDFILGIFRVGVQFIGLDDQFIGALPTAFMKPFSGSGARAMMLEAMNTYGVDSLQGRIAAIAQGSTETTFYVAAVYLGAAGIKKTRYLISTCLMADATGALAAILLGYLFFS